MMPITLGTTSRIPPATPDLAGRPTCDRAVTLEKSGGGGGTDKSAHKLTDSSFSELKIKGKADVNFAAVKTNWFKGGGYLYPLFCGFITLLEASAVFLHT